jgi:hypothetical protein
MATRSSRADTDAAAAVPHSGAAAGRGAEVVAAGAFHAGISAPFRKAHGTAQQNRRTYQSECENSPERNCNKVGPTRYRRADAPKPEADVTGVFLVPFEAKKLPMDYGFSVTQWAAILAFTLAAGGVLGGRRLRR